MVRHVTVSPIPARASCELPSPAGGMRCLMSLEAAGNMSLAEAGARHAFFVSLGIDPARVLALRQVHSQRVLTDGEIHAEGRRPDPPEADGILTADPHAVLTVTVADCLPIFLADARTTARGLLHSGWRGTGIVVAALARMRELYGTRSADVRAVIGPGIGSCCYDVPRERYEAFRERFGPASGEERGARVYLDLRRANLGLLEGLGVGEVTVVDDCTACTPGLASFRTLGPERYVGMVAAMGSF
jgi:YfiH family protein